MKTIFKLILFSFILNLATGIMATALPGLNISSGLFYDSAQADEFLDEASQTINTESQATDASDQIDRVLDKTQYGIFSKLINMVNNYMFGFVTVLEGMLGGYMESTLRAIIFGGLKTIITIGNTLLLIWFISGKNLAGGTNG